MKTRSRLLTWIAAVLAVFALVLGVSTPAFAAAGDVPAHGKHLQDNGDGTYTIALNVMGDSEKDPQKVNVIVIVDRSNSMNEYSGTGAYVANNGYGPNMYGLIDGEYRLLTRQSSGYGPYTQYTYWYNGTQYTGTRYIYDAYATRMEATRAAVNGLASTLLAYNDVDGNEGDTVEMALIDFATAPRTRVASTTDATTFINAVNGTTPPGGYAGGTNWEMALRQAGTIDFDDDDPTYVIFFSDGAPTFYGTGPSGTGQEEEPNMGNSYNASTDEAAALASKVGVDHFYTIFAYGSRAGQTYMTNLTAAAGAPAENNYSASSTVELEEAFAEILENIEMAGIGNVGINDGTTSNVGTSTDPIELLEVVPNFHYYRAGGEYSDLDDYDPENGQYGQEWTDAPEAEFTDPTVTWNIPGVLENDVIYTVTFDCYPSQTTLDYIADIKNDPSSYNSLPEAVKTYIDSDGNLKTNTTASLTYTDTRTGETTTKPYTNPDPVKTQTVEEMAVSKEWKNELEDEWAKPASITLDVTRDGVSKYDVTLNDGNEWSDKVYVSIGLIKGGEVLEGAEGHDFTFVEPPIEADYKWEIDVPVVHPMKIDGTVTMLILKGDAPYNNPDGAAEYTIGGKTYYVAGAGVSHLTATNERRSSLNIVKVVDGVDVPEDAVFPFTLNVVNSLAPESEPTDDPGHDSDYYVWISIWDKDKQAVTEGAVVSGATHAGDGWYYGVSSQDIVLNVKAGYSIRVNNVPVGTTYTVTEGTLPTGFTFESATASKTEGDDGGTTWTFNGGQTSTGSIDTTNAVYTVTYTNKYELIDINVDKVWVDASDQDGVRPDELELTLNGLPADVTAPDPEITKSEDGNTWTYTWSELPRYDTQGNEIKYTVTEGEVPEGYEVSGSPASDDGTITNTHTPETTEINVEKKWVGPAGDEVTVTLYANGEATGKTVTLNASNSWKGTFKDLPVYADGEKIIYTVVETGVSGVDTSKYTITVTSDAENGFTITNTNSETTDVFVKKVWVGPEATATITLVADGTATDKTITLPNDGSNEGSFTDLPKYNADGSPIVYTVTEDRVDHYDTTGPTGTGTENDPFTFTNTYRASGEVVLEAKKVLDGREWMEGESYTFTLYDSTGAVVEAVTVTEENASSVKFDAITYTEADAGKTYTYTISETSTLPANVSKSADISVSVKVTDNGDGTLTATPTYSPENATITNTYVPTPVKASITVNKTIDEYIAGSDKTFNFTMTPIDGAPMPEGKSELTASITTENGTGSATLDEITYTEPGTYQYKVVEKNEATAGWTYDTKEYVVTVTVTDDPETGKLSAEVSYGGGATAVDVHNLFEEKSASVKLHVDKVIDDQSGSAEDATFTFVLTPGEGAPGEAQTITITTNGLKGGADFEPIEFTESGTFNYTIQETGTAPSGWTYDTKAYPVVITVSDNFETAILESATTIDGVTATSLTITNVYKAGSTKSSLQVTKAIEDTSESAPETTFEFTLATTDGSPMPDTATATVTGAGTASFGEVEYTKAGEYHYTITETKGGGAGWTNDTTTYPVVVTVTDVDGQLVATATYGEKSETSLTVTNIYDPEDAKATPKALKVIDDQSGSAPDETFTFNLLDPDGNVVETKTRENGGPVEFSELTFDKVGTYSYSVQEVAGSTKGYAYDTAEHALTIKVTDAGDGRLVATVTYNDGEQATITNVYKAKPVEVNLEGEKTLEGGKKLEEGEFNFELTDPDGNKVEGTFANDADGNIAFGSYTFEKVGTYTYTATEVKGDNAQITYDSGNHAFTIVVTDKGGELVAEVTGDEGELVRFTNTYTLKPVAYDPPVQKVVTGDTPESSATFTFQMKAITEGAPMPSGAANGIKTMQITGAGSKEFGEMEFTEPGEWVYEITEVNTGEKGYTYDTTVYTLTVKVTQSEDGTLSLETALKGGEAIVFTNKYEKPPVTPKTADPTPAVSLIASIAALGSGFVAAGAARRRRER